MSIREIRKWEIRCDGEHPKGGPCGFTIIHEAVDQHEAAHHAIKAGWTQVPHPGTVFDALPRWFCNAKDGHR